MRSFGRGLLVVLVSALGLMPAPAVAATITIPLGTLGAGSFDFSGELLQQNDVALFTFDVDSTLLLSARTTSYATGGFDPVLTLLDSAGGFIADNDDEDAFGTPPIYDSFLERLLAPGSYTLAVTQSPNFFEFLAGGDGFGYVDETCPFAGDPTDPVCSVFAGPNGNFAGTLALTTPSVPEPALFWLVALGAAAMARRHSRS